MIAASVFSWQRGWWDSCDRRGVLAAAMPHIYIPDETRYNLSANLMPNCGVKKIERNIALMTGRR